MNITRYKNRLSYMFKEVDPAREEFVLAAIIILFSLMQIDWLNLVKWPNYGHLAAGILGGTQIWFVLHCEEDKISRWDRWRFIGDLIMALLYFVYAGIYYHQGASVIATLFSCSLIASLFCAYQSARRSIKLDVFEQNHAETGEVIFTKN